jgi:hypothetical protein
MCESLLISGPDDRQRGSEIAIEPGATSLGVDDALSLWQECVGDATLGFQRICAYRKNVRVAAVRCRPGGEDRSDLKAKCD